MLIDDTRDYGNDDNGNEDGDKDEQGMLEDESRTVWDGRLP